MRPKKTRWIRFRSNQRTFKPRGLSVKEMGVVTLSLDEFEALRLCDLKDLDQETVALQMGVHRSTISRILKSARKKVVEALVTLKSISIEPAGHCKFVER